MRRCNALWDLQKFYILCYVFVRHFFYYGCLSCIVQAKNLLFGQGDVGELKAAEKSMEKGLEMKVKHSRKLPKYALKYELLFPSCEAFSVGTGARA